MSLALVSRPNTRRHSRFHLTRRLLSGGVLGLSAVIPAFADPAPVIFNGTPEQVIPTYSEVGVGNYMPPIGTSSSINGGGTGTTSGGTTSTTASTGLSVMEAQSWGYAAAQNASALGVNPNALAATCVIESQCMNLTGTGTVAGAFQMTTATYQSSLAKALASDPSLADNIVTGSAGQMDPATESIAAAQYLKDTANTLEAAGVSNPTVLDVRGGYNFGTGYAAPLAQADSSQLMSAVLDGVSAKTFSRNGVTSTTTVGEWRQQVTAKLGNAANQNALTG